jgi:alanyl-tRNA synthetase
LNVPITEVEKRVEQLLAEHKGVQKELEQMKRASLLDTAGSLLSQVERVAGVAVLTAVVQNGTPDGLRAMLDKFRDEVKSGVGVLGTVQNDRPLVIAMVTDDLVQKGVHAGNLVREAAQMMGGGGGGKPNLAQAGGKDANRLPEALAAVKGLVAQVLGE